MKRLFHLSTTPRQLDMFEEDWEEIQRFVEKQQMDGIELGLTMTYPIEKIPKEIVKGVHLTFYPMWLDFWKQDQQQLDKLFQDKAAMKQYYQAESPEEWVKNYRAQLERARALEAEYMVFHVSHVLPEDSFFTRPLDYTDKDVLKAAVELINRAFPKDMNGPLLLFENLWWPGLNYKSPELTKWFIEQIEYPNKGLLVDISHLILNESSIGNEQEAYRYVKKVIEAHKDIAKWFKGVHLNKTLPKRYRQRDLTILENQYNTLKDKRQKLMLLKKHIKALDGHMPFDHPVAQKIIEVIKPQYCVYETAPQDRYELAYFIKKQNQALGIIK